VLTATEQSAPQTPPMPATSDRSLCPLSGHGLAVRGQIDSEVTLYQHDEHRTLIVGCPFWVLVADRMDAPLDLEFLGRARSLEWVDEMSDKHKK
jgi:hypothetical protein